MDFLSEYCRQQWKIDRKLWIHRRFARVKYVCLHSLLPNLRIELIQNFALLFEAGAVKRATTEVAPKMERSTYWYWVRVWSLPRWSNTSIATRKFPSTCVRIWKKNRIVWRPNTPEWRARIWMWPKTPAIWANCANKVTLSYHCSRTDSMELWPNIASAAKHIWWRPATLRITYDRCMTWHWGQEWQFWMKSVWIRASITSSHSNASKMFTIKAAP